jgi:hypothetical protein
MAVFMSGLLEANRDFNELRMGLRPRAVKRDRVRAGAKKTSGRRTRAARAMVQCTQAQEDHRRTR